MVTLTRSSRVVRGAQALVTTVVAAVSALALAGPVTAQQSPERTPSQVQQQPSVHGTVTIAPSRDISCPIPDGSEFVDSWGAPRSGGRRHQGVDMIADRGTPIVAVQSGTINFKRNRLGGNAAWLTTPLGNEFYYAHLDAFEGESRRVREGDVIGYVGSTGNAKGPHLHFEAHFDGQVGNPFDATFAACVQPHLDALAALDSALRAEPTVPLPGSTDAALVAHRTIDLLTS